METAINIGYSCSLLSNAYIQFILDESTPEKISEKIVTFLQDIQVHKKNDPKTRFALIISGDALIHAIKEPISKEVLKVAHVCEAVLCCRVSPKQKSEVVTLVRREVIDLTFTTLLQHSFHELFRQEEEQHWQLVTVPTM